MRPVAARIHPCLPVPRAERQRLVTAFYMALAALRRGARPREWCDCLAAALVALELLPHVDADPAAAHAARGSAHALRELLQGHGCVDGAVAACERFAPAWEALLAAATLRRLEAAKRAHAAEVSALLAVT